MALFHKQRHLMLCFKQRNVNTTMNFKYKYKFKCKWKNKKWKWKNVNVKCKCKFRQEPQGMWVRSNIFIFLCVCELSLETVSYVWSIHFWAMSFEEYILVDISDHKRYHRNYRNKTDNVGNGESLFGDAWEVFQSQIQLEMKMWY